MFGFLKDKLKKAVAAFSRSAESEVKEEKVEDASAIERAKEEERRIAKKSLEKKPAKEKKKEKPETKLPSVKRKEETEKEKSVIPTTSPKKEATSKKLRQTPEEKNQQRAALAKEEPEAPKKGFFSKLFGKEEKPAAAELEPAVASSIETSEKIEEIEEELREDAAIEEHAEETALEAATLEETEEKPGFFGKLKDAFTKKTLTPEKFDALFWELELAMLENNVAVEVIEKIKSDLRDELTSGKVSRLGIEDMITARLRQSVEELFDIPGFDLVKRIREGPRPFKVCMIGVNGSGKTTTLAKLVHLLQKEKLTCVVAASDTFRAAAIDQLKEHTDRLGVKLISQGYGSDPAAVAFDAIKHAESKGIDVVLIDTAGRLHSNTNLMQELEKVVRVSKPDLKIFIGESITGNDCIEQAQVFNRLVGIDAIILSKADIDEKGGAAISVSYVTKKPIIYLGMGQAYDDLVPFDKEKIIENLGLG